MSRRSLAEALDINGRWSGEPDKTPDYAAVRTNVLTAVFALAGDHRFLAANQGETRLKMRIPPPLGPWTNLERRFQLGWASPVKL